MTQWKSTINLAGVQAQLEAAAERAVLLGGEHVLGESSKVVPIEEGTLSRSGKVTAETQGNVAVAAVSYDTAYAARQHEELDYRHDEGRAAKYLETPLLAESDTVLAIAANEVGKVLR
jgi:hypothetical protein